MAEVVPVETFSADKGDEEIKTTEHELKMKSRDREISLMAVDRDKILKASKTRVKNDKKLILKSKVTTGKSKVEEDDVDSIDSLDLRNTPSFPDVIEKLSSDEEFEEMTSVGWAKLEFDVK